MSFRFDVSLPNSEKELADWIRQMMVENKITPSLIFRESMIQKKKEWEASQPDCLEGLKSKIEKIKKEVYRGNELMKITHEFINSLGDETREKYWKLWQEMFKEFKKDKTTFIDEIVDGE